MNLFFIYTEIKHTWQQWCWNWYKDYRSY